MDSLEQYETTDVVICGCGPTGAILSAYLGHLNVPHIVLEKEGDITTDPRGIALDEDGVRWLQGVGLYASIYADIGSCMHFVLVVVGCKYANGLGMGKFKFIGGTEKVLDKKAFLEMDYATVLPILFSLFIWMCELTVQDRRRYRPCRLHLPQTTNPRKTPAKCNDRVNQLRAEIQRQGPSDR